MKSSSTKIKLTIDTPLIISVLLLVIIGILSIYSANIMKSPQYQVKYLRQLIFLAIGIALFFMFLSFKYQTLSQYWFFYLIGSVIILLFTLVFARKIHNSRSWVFILGQGIQPSEIIKIFTILLLAKYLDNLGKKITKFKWLLSAILICMPIVGLILVQPDFGTALMYFPIIFTMIFVAGADKVHVLLLFVTGLMGLGIPLLTYYIGEILHKQDNVLLIFNKIPVTLITACILACISGILFLLFKRFKEKVFKTIMMVCICLALGLALSVVTKQVLKKHHYERFLAFVDKKRIDPRGAGWNIQQSLTAIGGGEFNGQGWLKGNQKNGGFLPASDTDFIFSVIAEEWGFRGSLVVFILFMIIIY